MKEDEDEESVHLATWPEVSRKGSFWANLFGGDTGRSVLEMMEEARDIVTLALEARDKAGIKVRQPLTSLSIPGTSKLTEAFRSIIADEVNVKIVVPHGEAVVLDTTLTDALKDEGTLRDVVREIQAFRKAEDLKPGEHVSSVLSAPQAQIDLLKAHVHEIEKATSTTITKWFVGEKRSVELDK